MFHAPIIVPYSPPKNEVSLIKEFVIILENIVLQIRNKGLDEPIAKVYNHLPPNSADFVIDEIITKSSYIEQSIYYSYDDYVKHMLSTFSMNDQFYIISKLDLSLVTLGLMEDVGDILPALLFAIVRKNLMH